PPRSARITGNFPARSTAGASYTLSHPLHLFGRTTYAQEVRFCPMPPEREDDDAGDEEDPPWFEEGEGDPSDGDPPPEPESCCSQGACRGEDGCDCGCDCCLGDDEGVDGGGEDAETCPVHEVDYDTCAPLHAEAYTNAVQSVEPIRDVLLIRDSPQYQEIHLVVPSGRPNCCPCPEHGTNYVGVAYRSRRLRVLGEDGNDFRISERTCDVRVAGVGPSAAPGDAELAFARNGEIYELRNYTVLGLEIRNGDASRPSLAEYNALSAALGYPLTVNTNVWHAPALELMARVRLPGGSVHLAFEGATGQFTLWYWDPVRSAYRRLLDTETGGTLDLEYNRWRRMFGVRSSRESVEAPVLVTSSSAGRVRLRFRYWAVVDGRFVEDEASQVLTSVDPPLLPDINHDGGVDAGDVAGWLEGRRFHFWQNQERVKGGCVGEDSDDSPNASDLQVNGAYDLLNFFPLALQVEPFRGAWGTSVTYRLEPTWPEEGMFNFCVAHVSRDSVADYQKSGTTTISGAPLSSTPLLALPPGGVSLPGTTVESLSAGDCMIVAEAPKPYVGLRLSILRGGRTLYSFTAPLHISPVREMYRLVELRGAVSDPNFSPAVQTRSPYGYPDEETDGTHFVFAHGYNVNEAEALVWHDQMFKRLWWAGSRSMYSGVVWNGSESQVQLPYAGGVTPDYYVNVGHAFATAPHLATAVRRLPGDRKYLAA
ncbi:MAG: hypothetical protein PUE68_08790, partial [Kiritimatiellae bacterium]|nr:hypothetical protein [Kiritimatiellia bacterium]